ncbi:hypothetical protein H5410_038702 [Solanum commersonii]|uniref:VQ domain-containing protein n=1 Tax=Solanum commersonii TaxID=4109 RepID=A0A9J5YEN4_SOLCO|nr:hypothetical protein H5410_038702 [Solanum commersonii]
MSNIPVKIVIINTQYIETDASSFKSVVQKLTGKNSTVAVESAFALHRHYPWQLRITDVATVVVIIGKIRMSDRVWGD